MPKAPEETAWSMLLAAHRTQVPRHASCDRVLILARDPDVLRWIDHELFAERVTTQIADGLVEAISALALVPPPWPQIFIVEVAAFSADVTLLRTIRDAGWPGTVIAIGEPTKHVRTALGIDVVLDRALGSEVLRNAIRDLTALRPRERKTAR